jgi:hypothetical protein
MAGFYPAAMALVHRGLEATSGRSLRPLVFTSAVAVYGFFAESGAGGFGAGAPG